MVPARTSLSTTICLPPAIQWFQSRAMTPGREIHTPPGGPPQADVRPDPAIFAAMGRENVFRMTEALYRELARSEIRSMFPPTEEELIAASRRQAMFLCGVLGGPPLYTEIVGPPRMRQRHLPFEIDETARREWLRCFHVVLENADEYGMPAEHLPGFVRFLEAFSAWMVNKT